MSKNLSTSARLGNLEARFDSLESKLVAFLDAQSPAKVTTPKARQPKAEVKPVIKAVTSKKALTCLMKSNRKAFIADHRGWATPGMSTLDLAIAVMHLQVPVRGGWDLGEGYDAKARTATPAAIKAVKGMLA